MSATLRRETMPTESPRQLLAPGILVGGRYRIHSHVASGGFGDVYSATHLVLESAVAIKVLRVERLFAHDASRQVGAFLDEARLLARLKHPNIVSVLDAGVVEQTSQPWIALDWCEGQTLREAIRGRGAHSPEDAWRLLRPIASALAHAHAAGVVHRDVKPSNVLLAKEEGQRVPKLVDFGIAKLIGDEKIAPDATQSRGPAVGFSPAYAAPEQVTGSPTGPWTDVHALGLVFIELVSGRDVYDREYPLESAISPERPHLPDAERFPALEAVMARAVALLPSRRFQSVAELTQELDHLLPGAAGPPLPSSESQHPSAAAWEATRDRTVPATIGASQKSQAPQETSPTSRGMAREATAHTARARRGTPFVIGGGIAVAMLAGSAVAYEESWGPFGHGASRSATQASDADDSHSDERAAPDGSAAPIWAPFFKTSTATPSFTAPPASERAPVHRDRVIAAFTLKEIQSRVHALHFTTEYENESNGGTAQMVTLTVKRDGCGGSILYERIPRAELAAQVIGATAEQVLATNFVAVDGNAIMVIGVAGAGVDKCQADLVDSLAPKK